MQKYLLRALEVEILVALWNEQQQNWVLYPLFKKYKNVVIRL